ncbi:MAG: macro domain-containing protein [Chitinophagaceae bacterium]
MRSIHYVVGDATDPGGSGNKVIAHICNDIGGWGKGFVTAISKRWKQPEQAYRDWYKSKQNFLLGECQFIQVTEDTWVANMIAQRDIRYDKIGNPPIRYDALSKSLKSLGNFSIEINASVHMPRIGCGLAGGSWDEIEPIIQQQLSSKSIEVFVYDFQP